MNHTTSESLPPPGPGDEASRRVGSGAQQPLSGQVPARNRTTTEAGHRSFLSRIGPRLLQHWPQALAITFFIGAAWFASTRFDPFIFPGPLKVLEAVREVLVGERKDILVTSLRFLGAFAVAILTGWGLAVIMGAFRATFGKFMSSLISIVQATPAISWILLSVLWFSSIELRIGFVTFIIALPIIVIAVYEGIRDMDRDLLEAIEQFRPTRWQVIRILLIPHSVVNLILVLRSTAAMTLKLMVLAELLGATNGIGRSMGAAQASFRIDIVFAWTVILIIANFLLLSVIGLIERRFLAWRAEAVVR